MSDDYADSSGGRPFGHDNMSTRESTELQIAVHAQSHESADAFWQQLEDRLRKKAKLSVCRSDDTGANVSVHLLTADDFADVAARDDAVLRIARNAAAVNVLLEPAVSEAEGYRRMKEALSNLADRPDYVRFASKEDAPIASMARHAKSVAKFLIERFATPELPVSEEHEGPSGHGLANEPAGGANKPSGAASDRERKARKRAERRARRDRRKAPEGGSSALTVSIDAAPEPEIDSSGKRARKRSKKMDRQDAAARDRSKRKARRGTAEDKSNLLEGESGKRKAIARQANDAAKAKTVARESRAAKKARKGEGTGRKSALKKKNREKPSKADGRRIGDSDGEKRDTIATARDVKLANGPRKDKRNPRRREQIRGSDDAQPILRPAPIRICISGLSANSLGRLRPALERKSPGIVVLTAEAKQKADVAIYAFENPALDADAIAECAGSIVEQGARARIFLERADLASENRGDVNGAIAKLASACDGRVLRINGKLDRYGDLLKVDRDGLTDDACQLIAASILRLAASTLSRPSPVPVESLTPPDLAEARVLAGSAPEFLAQLRWSERMPPRLLYTHTSREAVEALVNDKLALPSQAILALSAPIAWPREMPDRATGIQILGLEFLVGPLDYWLSKSAGRSGGKISEIDALLKEHGIKASEILLRAEKIMLDFIQNHPPDQAPNAWQEIAVSRRARACLLYVLCCKTAIARRIQFDKAAFTIIFQNLLDLIELLRADDFYKPASRDGFQQDGLLIGLALALRGSNYGDRLLAESLDRLQKFQLDPGLTSDGVWRTGPYSEHCSLLAMLRILMVDFDKSDAVMIEPFAAVAKKMTLFAEAMLKSNGSPPAFDDSGQKSYARELSGTRHALAQAEGKSIPMSKIEAMPRITETYVFRDAQYFVSHSTQNVSKDSSLVLLHADGPSIVKGDPGGVTLAFAHGDDDLLIRAEPEKANRRDKSSLFDSALRNGYHVNGSGYDERGGARPSAARIVKSWRGPGWAGAKCTDEINSTVDLSRIVVHLKDVHALLIIDSLRSLDGTEATFEQFWHMAPGLVASLPSDGTLRFSAASGGELVVALDHRGAVTVESEGEGMRVRREVRMTEGILASMFQWAEEVAPATVDVASDGAAGWTAVVTGAGFNGRFMLDGADLRFERNIMA